MRNPDAKVYFCIHCSNYMCWDEDKQMYSCDCDGAKKYRLKKVNKC
jgi:hypothetical protein